MARNAKLTLAEGNIPRLLLSFATTTLIALLLNSVYNLTDTLFVSWGVGDNAMGGVSIVFPFVILQSAISTAVGGGAASIISRKLGEGKNKEAGDVALNAMLTFYITAVTITVTGLIFMEPVLKLMGVTGDIYPYAREYYIIILLGNVFSTGFSSIIRAEGRMLYSLLIWVIPISINIILDAIFILGLKWGVRGSALATVICQFTSFVMSVLFFTRLTSLDFKGAKFKGRKIGEIIGIGLPSLVQMGSMSIMFLILNNIMSKAGGTLGVNTFAYVTKIIAFIVVPFTAIAQALAPIVGYNYGANNRQRVSDSMKFSILISIIYALIALLITELTPAGLIKLFTDSKEIISLGTKGLRIVSLTVLFTPFPILAGASFQAIGRKLSAGVMYILNLIFLLPAAFLLSSQFGVSGIWWAYVIASVCASFTAILIVLMNRKKILA
jgi:putative MATE family efflux protein